MTRGDHATPNLSIGDVGAIAKVGVGRGRRRHRDPRQRGGYQGWLGTRPEPIYRAHALVAALPTRLRSATIVQLHANTIPAPLAEPAGRFAFGIEVKHDPGSST